MIRVLNRLKNTPGFFAQLDPEALNAARERETKRAQMRKAGDIRQRLIDDMMDLVVKADALFLSPEARCFVYDIAQMLGLLKEK